MKLSILLLLSCLDLLFHSPLVLAARTPTSDLKQPSARAGYQTRRPSYVVFHPDTRSCVIRKSLSDPLKLGPCDQSDSWEYTPQKFLVVEGTYFCLQAVQSGRPAQLGITCSVYDSSWDITSNAKTQISAKRPGGGDGGGGSLCLDVDAASNTLVTNPCRCQSSGGCDLGSQWFQFASRSQVQGSEVAHLDAYDVHNSP